MTEEFHVCEVCHKEYTDSAIIAVEDIEWERVFPWFIPWYICQDCAQKISSALKRKNEGKKE